MQKSALILQKNQIASFVVKTLMTATIVQRRCVLNVTKLVIKQKIVLARILLPVISVDNLGIKNKGALKSGINTNLKL